MKLMKLLTKLGRSPSSSSSDERTLLKILTLETLEGSEVPDAASDTQRGCAKVTTIREAEEKIALVHEHFRKINAHNLKSLSRHHTKDAMWFFYTKEGELVHEMGLEDFADGMVEIFASFPDFRFRRHTVKASRNGTVTASNSCACGTHTGKPFGFGPFEAIEPSGKFVQNDPEDVIVSFRDGKICRYDVHSRGFMTGPAGIYSQLGGFPAL